MLELRRCPRNLINDAGRRGCRIAQRIAADLGRGAEISLEHRWRKRLHISNVVEAVTDRVRRQQRGNIDVQAEQILNSARVLGTIEPLERTMTGIRVDGGGAINSRFE